MRAASSALSASHSYTRARTCQLAPPGHAETMDALSGMHFVAVRALGRGRVLRNGEYDTWEGGDGTARSVVGDQPENSSNDMGIDATKSNVTSGLLTD